MQQADVDKLNLFKDIRNVKWDELPVKKRIQKTRNGEVLIDDVNLRQIVSLLNRSYGSVYNMYMSILEDLKQIVGQDIDDVKVLFDVPADVYFYHLAKQTDVYDFYQILLNNETVSFDDFIKDHESSKATGLRHLKNMRDLIRKFGLKIFYDPIRIEGDEFTVRLVFALFSWVLTSGHAWPFAEFDRDNMLQAVDDMAVRFKLKKPNLVSREIGAHFLAITYLRVVQGHYVADEDKIIQNIKFPYPNMAKVFMRADYTKDATTLRVSLGNLSERQAFLESGALYFMLIYGPIPYEFDDTYLSDDQRYERFNGTIYKLTNQLLDYFPFDLIDYMGMDAREERAFKNNLIISAMTTFIFGQDINSMFVYHMVDDIDTLRHIPELEEDVDNALDHIMVKPEFSELKPYREKLGETYYNLIHQLINQFVPEYRIKVVLMAERSYLGFLGLMETLNNIRYVDVSVADEDLKDADMIIQTTSLALPDYTNPQAIRFNWNINDDSDHYARLYGILHELWIKKSFDIAE